MEILTAGAAAADDAADGKQAAEEPSLGATEERLLVAPAEQLILVDEHDRAVGVGEKLATHRAGALHRAFSVFVFDADRRLLLQRRARTKYHSAGLWSNTACGHPRPGEATDAAARRRLREEMGFDCALRHAFAFVYRAELPGGLCEHEYDHVFVGEFAGTPAPAAAEVEAWAWVTLPELRRELRARPERFSYWLRLLLDGPHWPRLHALVGAA